MKILGIIPARFASTRFPGKPLVDIAGKSMIQRVYEQCSKSASLSDLVVATDDQRIMEHVIAFGGQAIMTSSEHPSGTDRCHEAAQHFPDHAIVVNIQGDEPLIDPKQIDLVCSCFEDENVQIASLIKKITSTDELLNENTPKVVKDSAGNALYFSRAPIPFKRSLPLDLWLESGPYFKHIGIYGYRARTLAEITALGVSELELTEALEQLRWLENGLNIRLALTDIEGQAIDTPDDLRKLLLQMKNSASG